MTDPDWSADQPAPAPATPTPAAPAFADLVRVEPGAEESTVAEPDTDLLEEPGPPADLTAPAVTASISAPVVRPGPQPAHHAPGSAPIGQPDGYLPVPGAAWRIATKLRVLVAVPLAAVIGFAGLALAATGRQVQAATSTRSLVIVADRADGLIRQLQRERITAAVVLTGPTGPASVGDYREQAAVTDDAITAYRGARDQVRGTPVQLRAELARVDTDLSLLSDLRQQVESGPNAAASAVTFQYRTAIADLLNLVDDVAQSGQLPDVARDLRAAAALGNAVEAVGEEQVEVVRALAAGALTAAAQVAFITAQATYQDSVTDFGDLATPSWRTWLDQALTGPEVVAAQRLIDQVARTSVGSVIPVAAADWVGQTSVLADRLWSVASRVDQVVVSVATADRSGELRLALIEAVAVLVAAGGVVAVGWWLGRPLIFRLRRLRDGARSLAYHGLPDSVRQLRREGSLGALSAREFATRLPVPGWGAGRDEISQVGEAFVEVHRVAVEIAAEQAAERAHLGTIFVNLARRGDRMVGRLTRELDEVERTEHDPERLARLFALDHLVTLLGRSNRTLLVLGGQGSARVRDADVPLRTVLQAALAQVERYTQVELDSLAQEVLVRREAVDDLVHLFAELLDNATMFAPADAPTHVFTHRLGERVVVQIADSGVGLGEQKRTELNARLAAPPGLDVTAADAMGLTAVGRIAAVYGIGVELRLRPGQGTVAEVSLPLRLLRDAPDDLFGGALSGDLYGGLDASAERAGIRPRGLPPPRRPPDVEQVVVAAGADAGHSEDQLEIDFSAPARALFDLDTPLSAADVVGDDGSGPDSLELPIFRAARSAWFAEGASGFDAWSTVDDPGWQAAERSAAAAQAVADQVTSAETTDARPGTPADAGGDDMAPDAAADQLPPDVAADQLPADVAVDEWPPDAAADQLPPDAADAAAGDPDSGALPPLPRRVPMAWLVPGAPSGAEPNPADRRDPRRVAATMAAYQRGVAASRAKRGTDAASPPTATITK